LKVPKAARFSGNIELLQAPRRPLRALTLERALELEVLNRRKETARQLGKQ